MVVVTSVVFFTLSAFTRLSPIAAATWRCAKVNHPIQLIVKVATALGEEVPGKVTLGVALDVGGQAWELGDDNLKLIAQLAI